MLISVFQSVRFFRLFVFVYPEHFNFRLACVQTPPPLKNDKKYVRKYDKDKTIADWKVPAYQLNHCI